MPSLVEDTKLKAPAKSQKAEDYSIILMFLNDVIKQVYEAASNPTDFSNFKFSAALDAAEKRIKKSNIFNKKELLAKIRQINNTEWYPHGTKLGSVVEELEWLVGDIERANEQAPAKSRKGTNQVYYSLDSIDLFKKLLSELTTNDDDQLKNHLEALHDEIFDLAVNNNNTTASNYKDWIMFVDEMQKNIQKALSALSANDGTELENQLNDLDTKLRDLIMGYREHQLKSRKAIDQAEIDGATSDLGKLWDLAAAEVDKINTSFGIYRDLIAEIKSLLINKYPEAKGTVEFVTNDEKLNRELEAVFTKTNFKKNAILQLKETFLDVFESELKNPDRAPLTFE